MPRFAILFAVEFENNREAARLVIVRRFVEHALGPDVTILDEAVFPDYSRYGFLAIVEAANRRNVEEAVKPAAGIFKTLILDVSSLTLNPQVARTGYGLFAINTPHNAKRMPDAQVLPTASVAVRFHMTFPPGSPCSDIWLLDAPAFNVAKSFGHQHGPGGIIETARAQPMKEYFEEKRSGLNTVAAAPAPVRSASEAQAGGYTIYNDFYIDAVVVDSSQAMPFSPDMPLAVCGHYKSMPVTSDVYVWEKGGSVGKGGIAGYLSFRVNYGYWNNFSTTWVYQMWFDWRYPALVIPRSSTGIIGFAARTGHYYARSDLYLWLQALMSTNSFDASWPEDSYSGGMAAAYTYILSRIPGRVPPKAGTIKDPEVVNGIDYPPGVSFTADEFKAVKTHLLLEIGCFVTADRWFGPAGIINAINSKIAIVSSNDLTEACQLMSIDPEKTSISLILDAVFGEIVSVISVIPDIGAAFGAVIATGWAIAKASMGPGVPQNPVQVTIAQMADQLNQYLETMTDAAQQQLNTLYGNWGRLQEFSNGVIEGKISPNQFYGGGQTSAAPRSGDSSPPLPGAFLEAAANAWLVIVYKQLFASIHAVQSNLSFSTAPPSNPWNPDAGQYAFTWSLPCNYNPGGKNSQPTTGYMVVSCATDASSAVLQQLFGAHARLQVNPLQFFAGFNGWPTPLLTYDAGYDTNYWHPLVPVNSIGLPSWSADQHLP